MIRIASLVALLLLALPAAARAPAADPAPLAGLVARVAIPHQAFTLPNGLRVVVHTDRRAPLVHVGVWYHVGSRDEPLGRSGFAHLFEHIMFRGSAHSRQDHFRTLEEVGATDFNGTTDFDRTNYFQTVPTPALDLALFLESDRMGWLLPALDQQLLDAERSIVLNEKRQGENAPGGLVFPALLAAIFPPDHPYHVPAIGQVADLEAATLDDARQWFRRHYGPNNAVLVLAGDIDVAEARPLVERWFGQIPPGPVPGRFASPPPERPSTTRQTLSDRVAQVRLLRSWAIPGRHAPDLVDLEVAMTLIAGGPTALLVDRLVRVEQLAVAVSGSVSAWEGAGLASIAIEVRPGVDPAAVEARADALLAQWLERPPAAADVARVATRAVAASIRGLERLGGFGGRGPALADGALFHGDPGRWQKDLAALAEATPASVQAAARRHLRTGDHRITVTPGERRPTAIVTQRAPPRLASADAPPPPFRPVGTPVDRSAGPPAAGPATQLAVAPVERARLANGMAVELARHDAVPVVRVQLSFPGGIAADRRDRPGTQRLMLALLREGSNGRLGRLDGLAIAARAEELGAVIGASAGLDRTRLSLNAIAPNLAASLALFADVVRAPTFPPAELERVRAQLLASLAAEAVNPNALARRALPPLLYGPDHPYGLSFTGNGTREGVASVSADDLSSFHRGLDAARATIHVVGDVTMAELLPLLDSAFGDWPAPALPAVGPPPPVPPAPARIILYHRPDSAQSVIVAGSALPLSGRDDTLALTLANDIWGGMATARLNRLLREEKNWSYGAFSGFSLAVGPMPFTLSAPVDAARTGESIAAIRQLLADWHGSQPPTAAELDRARAALIRSLTGDLETGGARLAALERATMLGRPDDFLETLAARAAAVPLAAVRAAPIPRADQLLFVVVGDRAVVEPQLAALGLPVEVRTSAD